MNIELQVDPPKFQVGDWVRLSHPLYKKNTVGMITQTRCSITVFTVKSPSEFAATETRYVYFLHNLRTFAFFAEADLEYVTAEMADEIGEEK